MNIENDKRLTLYSVLVIIVCVLLLLLYMIFGQEAEAKLFPTAEETDYFFGYGLDVSKSSEMGGLTFLIPMDDPKEDEMTMAVNRKDGVLTIDFANMKRFTQEDVLKLIVNADIPEEVLSTLKLTTKGRNQAQLTMETGEYAVFDVTPYREGLGIRLKGQSAYAEQVFLGYTDSGMQKFAELTASHVTPDDTVFLLPISLSDVEVQPNGALTDPVSGVTATAMIVFGTHSGENQNGVVTKYCSGYYTPKQNSLELAVLLEESLVGYLGGNQNAVLEATEDEPLVQKAVCPAAVLYPYYNNTEEMSLWKQEALLNEIANSLWEDLRTWGND